ncbi:hypothetical protein BSKO_03397 [Bryopsis sp. KO-2023]|nr:hypothetical protein BSKO_03397 [Bryopsis sp. KO-2023]
MERATPLLVFLGSHCCTSTLIHPFFLFFHVQQNEKIAESGTSSEIVACRNARNTVLVSKSAAMPPTAVPATTNQTRVSVDVLYRVRPCTRRNKDSLRSRSHRCRARRTNKEDAVVTDSGYTREGVQVDGIRKQLSWGSPSTDEADEILGSTRSGRRSKKLQGPGESDEPSTNKKSTASSPVLESRTQPVPGYKEVDGSMVKDSGCFGRGMRWYLLSTNYRKEKRAVEHLMAEIPKLPPLAAANGELSERKFSVWHPTKETQAWNNGTKKMSKKTLKYANGDSIFLECVMDNEIFNLVKGAIMIRSFKDMHPLMDWVPMPCTDALIQNAYDWIWEDHDVDEQETHRRLEGSEFEVAKEYLFIPDVDEDPQSTDDAVEFIDLVTAGKSVEENAQALREKREQEENKALDRIVKKQRPRKSRRRRDDSRSRSRDDNSRWSKSGDKPGRASRSDQDWFESPAVSASSSAGGAADWDSGGQVSDEQSWSKSSDKDLASWDAEWENKGEEESVEKISRDALGEDTSTQEAKFDPPADDDLSDLISDFSASWGDVAPVEEGKQAMGEEESEADIASLFVDKWDDPGVDTDDAVEFSNDFDGEGEGWGLDSSLMDSLGDADPLERADDLISSTNKRAEGDRGDDSLAQIPVPLPPPEKKVAPRQSWKKGEPSVTADDASSKTTVPGNGFGVGDSIAVVSGPFQEFGGKVVSEVSESRIKVELDIFGRSTTVEIDVDSLEKK